MDKDKVINELIEFYVEEYSSVFLDGLRDILTYGFKGFKNLSDKELEEELKKMKEEKGEE